MSGSISLKSSFALSLDNLSNSVIEAHKYNKTPKFGGELEVMGVIKRRDGQIIPADYEHDFNQAGTRDFVEYLINREHFKVDKEIDSKPIRLSSDSGEIICFENYAAVMERTDKAYEQKDGLTKFAKSIDHFADELQDFSEQTGVKFSPFDYDVFCEKEDYEGKHAPSERFGENGTLANYDAEHPLVEEIDMRTTSSHFSVGYKDKEHLWRQIRIANILTPALYAVFAGSPPTVEASINGETTILAKNKAKELADNGEKVEVKQQLLVPRARLWTLSDPERTGIDKNVAKAIFKEGSTFENYINILLDKEAIIAGDGKSPFREAFTQAASKDGEIKVENYMDHVSTCWYDVRVDLLRLESRMAGNSPWKSKAIGALLTTILLNDEATDKVEELLNNSNINSETLLKAREEVAIHSLKTPMDVDGEITTGDILSEVVKIANDHIELQSQHMLAPIKEILDSGVTDSDFLKSIEDDVELDYSEFLDLDYSKLEPFVTMHKKGMLDHILNKENETKPNMAIALSM